MFIKSSWARKCLSYVFGFLLASTLAACGGGGDGGGGSSAIFPINSSGSAENAAKDIVEVCLEVRSALSNGTYQNAVVNGNSGTATVNGEVSFLRPDCGSLCVRSENNTSINIVFNNFVVNTADNTTTTISGSIDYSDTTFSQQTSSGFSSGGSISIFNNTDISYELIGTDAAGTFGTRDTITFVDSSGTSVFDQSGAVITASGTFTF